MAAQAAGTPDAVDDAADVTLDPVGAGQGVIARLIPVDDDLGADLDRVARDAATQQGVRRAAFNRPLFSSRRGLLLPGNGHFFDRQVNPRVRIDQLDLGDRAL